MQSPTKVVPGIEEISALERILIQRLGQTQSNTTDPWLVTVGPVPNEQTDQRHGGWRLWGVVQRTPSQESRDTDSSPTPAHWANYFTTLTLSFFLCKRVRYPELTPVQFEHSVISKFNLMLRSVFKESSIQKSPPWASPVVQWLRIRLPMQGTRVRALVREDPTCRRATKPVCHNFWACALEPVRHNYWSPHT